MSGYHVYASPSPGAPIDFASPIATIPGLSTTTWTSGGLLPGDWRFCVRAYDANGEEQNISCSVEINLDATGADVSNVPLPPTGLRAFATPGGGIRCEFWY